MNTVREPAVAGLFYPGNARELATEVNTLLHAARHQDSGNNPQQSCKAIIVPHAGYRYSGSTAASAFARLYSQRDSIQRVILLGPAHRIQLRGLAVMDVKYFRSPLGDIPQDSRAVNQLLTLPQVQTLDAAHWQEHSLEVQLPFLQTVLKEFTLVPIAIGSATALDVDQVLDLLWGGPETLIVISSDLSHYHDYKTAQYIDRSTCEAIEQLDIEHIDYQQACGCVGVKGLLRVARRRHLSVITLALCNSGDTAGDPARVVGYGSWVFSEEG